MSVFALLLAVAVQAGDAPAAAPAPVAPTEKKVCWRDQVTGSMMPARRICMTVAERRAWLARMQNDVDTANDRRMRGPRAGSVD
jgi:hypothetical protein